MPPRLNFPSTWASSQLCLRQAKPPTSSSLPRISIANASSKAKIRQRSDPYALAQAQARKEANLRRQAELRKEREAAIGDPVRGITTPFVESLDKAAPFLLEKPAILEDLKSLPAPNQTYKAAPNPTTAYLNHFIKPTEVETSLQHSFILTQPLPEDESRVDPIEEAEAIEKHREQHDRAAAAIMRIVNLQNGNSKDRMRVNKAKCIETFGRHNTDLILPPKLPSNVPRGPDAAEAGVDTPRAGPDTGSSEVQIAILTTKIRALANNLHSKDKMNKRNLTILVHKRAKLLKYLRRKDHGGPRWKNLIETLGLTEGTWKGEITL